MTATSVSTPIEPLVLFRNPLPQDGLTPEKAQAIADEAHRAMYRIVEIEVGLRSAEFPGQEPRSGSPCDIQVDVTE